MVVCSLAFPSLRWPWWWCRARVLFVLNFAAVCRVSFGCILMLLMPTGLGVRVPNGSAKEVLISSMAQFTDGEKEERGCHDPRGEGATLTD